MTCAAASTLQATSIDLVDICPAAKRIAYLQAKPASSEARALVCRLLSQRDARNSAINVAPANYDSALVRPRHLQAEPGFSGSRPSVRCLSSRLKVQGDRVKEPSGA